MVKKKVLGLIIRNNFLLGLSYLDLIIFIFSMIVYAVYALGFPLSPGRDFGTYAGYFVDFFSPHPSLHLQMLFRTPAAPLFIGTFHNLGGAVLVEVIIGFLFGSMVVTLFKISSKVHLFLGFIVIFLIFINLNFNIFIHRISSDNLFSISFVSWSAFLFSFINNPTNKKSIYFGLFTFFLVLIRPSSQILLVVLFFPLLLSKLKINFKAGLVFRSVSTYILLVLLFSSINLLRYQDFTVSRGSNAFLPLYRLFTLDRLVSPTNGENSKQLGQLVESELLTREPYLSYLIDKDLFFEAGDPRMWGDLVPLVDDSKGWDTDYKLLQGVAMEAIWRHPKEYLLGVCFTLLEVYKLETDNPSNPLNVSQARFSILKAEKYRELELKKIPLPTEDSLIPGSSRYWLSSSPRGNLPDKKKLNEYLQKINQITLAYPPRPESVLIKSLLVNVERINRFFKPYLLLLLGIGNLFLLRKKEFFAFFLIQFSSYIIILVTYMGFDAVLEYRITFDPILILTAATGSYAIAYSLKGRLLKND